MAFATDVGVEIVTPESVLQRQISSLPHSRIEIASCEGVNIQQPAQTYSVSN